MFIIDPILRRDTISVAENAWVMLRLMDDARFPWAILIPKTDGAVELSDLPEDVFHSVVTLARDIGVVMQEVFGADKVNTAAIGNVVSQVHVHVIARRKDDVLWPSPVWGNGTPIPMSQDVRDYRLSELQSCTPIRTLGA